MDVFSLAIGLLLGIGACGAIPRIAVGFYSKIKGKAYKIVEVKNEF